MANRAVVRQKQKLVTIGPAITIDACAEESHQLTNTITDHPVERGTNISDHVRPDPDLVTLQCFVSNTPLSQEQQTRTIREGNLEFESTSVEDVPIGQDNGRGARVFAALEKLRLDGTMVQVVTTLKTYALKETEGMVIQSITIPRRPANYDGLEFSITLKQIRIVKTRRTQDVRSIADKRTVPKQKTGAQTPQPKEDISALKRGADFVRSDNASIAGFGRALGF
jgi:hypothetical protein